MKKWIHSQNRQIVITMLVDDFENSIAASNYLDHPLNIRKKDLISDKHLEYLNDIIATFDHNLQVAGFEIIDRHSSKKGYSYYITFIPVTESGQELLPIDLIFRVSNHSSKSSEGSQSSNFARIISFTLEHESFDEASELIYEGIHIIRELKKGNTKILDQI